MSYGDNDNLLLIKFKCPIPSEPLDEGLRTLVSDLFSKLTVAMQALHTWNKTTIVAGEIIGVRDKKVLVGLEGWPGVCDDVIEKYFADNSDSSVSSIRVRRKTPAEFLTDEERAQVEAERTAKKQRDERLATTTTIQAIQRLTLYKCSDGDFVLTFQNKRIHKAFYWFARSQRWRKTSMPNKEHLSPCSPLEFTVQVGTTFAKTVEDNFGLEIVGRDSRGEPTPK